MTLSPSAWKKTLLALLAAALIGLTIWLGIGPSVALYSAVRTDFVVTVVATGRVQAPHRVDVGAQVTGPVVRVPVAEGQFVKAGTVLVELDAAELNAAVRQAELAVMQAQARVRQVLELQVPVAEQAVLQARISQSNAEAQWRRLEALQQRGFIGIAALDDSRKTVDLARAQVTVAQQQLKTLGAGGSDRALAQAALEQSQAAAQAARVRAGYASIRAPVDGTLISRNVEAGDVVQPARVLMTLSPAGRTQVVLAVDEKNLRFLALGQGAVVSADAYPLERFDARLTYINPGINAQTGAVEVKLDVAQPPLFLREDMTVSVNVEVARHRDAIVIPADAVHDGDRDSPWVLRWEAGRLRHTPIRIGGRSAGFTQVLQGLQTGDQLAPAGATLRDGQRVRPMASVRAQAGSSP
jgi:HlyD family secretion protein